MLTDVTHKQEKLGKSQERIVQRIDALGFSFSSFLIHVLVVESFIIGLLYLLEIAPKEPKTFSVVILIGLLLGSAFYFTIFGGKLLYFRLWQKNLETQLISEDTHSLQESINEENFFNNLVAINFKYIDKYYLQTQVQADKSFFLCTIAAVVSLFIISIGILLMFAAPSRFPAALLITATGVLGEIIAAVFFYLYNRTISEMSEYHQKLVLTQNISLAMKIAQGLPDSERAAAQLDLVKCLSKDINMYLCLQGSKSLSNGSKVGEPTGT